MSPEDLHFAMVTILLGGWIAVLFGVTMMCVNLVSWACLEWDRFQRRRHFNRVLENIKRSTPVIHCKHL